MNRIEMPRRLARFSRLTSRARRSSGVAAFAQRLLARYAWGRAVRRAIAFPLVCPRPVFVQNVLRRYSLGAPPLWTVGPSATLEFRRHDQTASQTWPFHVAPAAAPAPTARASRHALLLRIVQRARRVEVDVKNSPPALKQAGAARVPTGVRPAADALLPLALPVVAGRTAATPAARLRDRASTPALDEREAAAPGSPEGDSRPPSAPRALQSVAVPEQEIERLTERVIGRIDRRIAAQRERLGRP